MEHIISSDIEAQNLIKKYKLKDLHNLIYQNLIEVWIILWEQYSFINNQTYPRPSHPNINFRKEVIYTICWIIISLRTTLENEKKATNNLINEYPDIDLLKFAKVEKVADLIKVAWMQNNKAEKIVNIINSDIDYESLKQLSIKEIINILEKLPWVWQKSIDCILLLWLDKPSFIVDINVFRLINRLFWLNNELNFNSKKQVLEVKNFLETNLPKDTKLYQILHTLFLLHWKYICKSKPKCRECFIKRYCKYEKR